MATEPSFPTYADLTQTQAWIGRAAAPVEAPSVTSSPERYVEGALLGSGGMGKVMLARDVRIGREVAVKALHEEHKLTAEDRARFLREAQVQGQLEHPSIVPVYDIDQRPDGTTYFTMRRVLGRTLAAILDDERAGTSRYTQRELLQAFATVCLAIDYAHTRGVVHRDLKPANIMLGDFGEVYILDWGIARLIERPPTDDPDAPAPRLSTPGTMLGTPLYMPPEQVADPDVGPLADVWSLGAILFEILTLARLRETRAILAPVEARPSVRTPERTVAPELEQICVTATELEDANRFPSARALQEAVARYLEGDRELAQRRTMAAAHAARARELLASSDEHERGLAMKELVRALALEPTHDEYVALLAETITTPPRTVPPQLERRFHAQEQAVMRSGAKYVMLAMTSWFLFLPAILALGIRRFDYALLIAIPALVTVGVAFAVTRRREIRRPIQYVGFALMMLAGMTLSRLFGPLILMPSLLATSAVVYQAHPDRGLRRMGLVGSVCAIVLPVLLELSGVLPASYAFEHGTLVVLPQLTELPRVATLVFLGLTNVAIAVVPSLYVAQLRNELAETQRREQLQGWNFRRLGRDLIAAKGAG